MESSAAGPESSILLIHLGGLGDVCLSESTFLSLLRRFGGGIHALGYERFLNLFDQYFEEVHRVESIKWLHLFSDNPSDVMYRQIVFVGKDREGNLRKRWQRLSREPLVFVEMYPEDGKGVGHSAWLSYGDRRTGQEPERTLLPAVSYELSARLSHVEDYQLAQLKQYGIEAVKAQIEAKPLNRVILYPEKGFSKKKWPPEDFIELYRVLRARGLRVEMLQALGLELDVEGKFFFEELNQVRDYFQEGGIFVSNDSGMAHLAGLCGLMTITIFNDFDPALWHPRGRNISLKSMKDRTDVPTIEALILNAMEVDRKTGL